MLTLNAARRPAGPTYFLSVACHHCEQPACVRACPSGAYQQRPDGRIVHNERLCVGCRYCEMACPFGVPRFDGSRGVMGKCDYCESRTASGEGPACIAACPTEALRGMGSEERGTRSEELATRSEAAVPGFADPAGYGPRIRFKAPRGIRGSRLQALLRDWETR